MNEWKTKIKGSLKYKKGTIVTVLHGENPRNKVITVIKLTADVDIGELRAKFSETYPEYDDGHYNEDVIVNWMLGMGIAEKIPYVELTLYDKYWLLYRGGEDE